MSSVLVEPPSPAASRPLADTVTVPLVRITGEQYDRMVEAGIVGEGDPVELVGGLLVEKMPKSPLHVAVVLGLVQALGKMAVSGHVRMESPIQTDYGRPEPDVCLVVGQRWDYFTDHPTAADVRLLIEVAGSSLPVDRGIKATEYARAGITPYLIVDLESRQFLVLTEPSADGYASEQAATSYEVVIDGTAIGTLKVDELFPLKDSAD